MKTKSTVLVLATLFAGVMSSSAVTMLISNANAGPGDTLWASSGNVPMNGGIVAIGYFNAGVTQADINTIPGLVSKLGQFTVVTSITPGSFSTTLGGSFAGYADQFDAADVVAPINGYTSIGLVSSGALLNRVVYAIASSAADLLSATGSSEFALINLGAMTGDVPNELSFVANPSGTTPIIGTVGTVIGDFAGDNSVATDEFGTLKMAVNAVPEPSAALLGAIGALGLLRRRRI